MDQPLVSILIITYNQREFINETLQSALDQDYPNLEVVVSDDASTDGTAEVIQKYALKYPGRLVPITANQRLGITGNSNRALKACHGKYIAFQGGDDILLPGKINSQVAWMEEHEKRVLCTHDAELFDSATGRILYYWSDMYQLKSGTGLGDLLRHGHPCIGPGTAIMVRASSMPRSGFDDRLEAASDILFFYKCLASGGDFGYIPRTYARYRQHQQNIQRTGRQMLIQDSFKIIQLLEAEHPEYSKYMPAVKHLHFHSLAVWSIRDKESIKARKYILEAVRYKPFAFWKYCLLYMYTFLPDPLPSVLMNLSSRAYKSIHTSVNRVIAGLSVQFHVGRISRTIPHR